MWERLTEEDQYPLVSGEFGGGPESDLITATVRFEEGDPIDQSDDATSIVLIRVDGRNGETLLETKHPIEEPTGSYDAILPWLYAGPMEDASGDSQSDVFAGYWILGVSTDEEGEEFEIVSARSSYAVESGRDGAVLDAIDSTSWVEMWPAPDLNGDGLADLSEWTYPIDDEGAYSAQFRGLSPATELWGRSFSQEEIWETTFWPTPDQDGMAGGEVIYGLNKADGGHWRSLISSLVGATGSERWRQER